MNGEDPVPNGTGCSRAFVLTLALAVEACGSPPAPRAPDITPSSRADGWDISTPEEQGVSSEALERAYRKAALRPYMYSTLVVRHGVLVAEAYFHGAAFDQARYVASVTKSYMSAMIGIAVREGFLPGLDQHMMPYFPEYDSEQVEDAKRQITLRQLLQMRAGYWLDSETSRWEAWMRSGDLVGYMVRLGLENPPGTRWSYSSGSTHLLSAILTKATGMRAEEFARHYLFEPIGTELARWGRDAQGYNLGGWDMYVTPRDLARFGQLYLDGGAHAGLQVVPADWVRESTAPLSRVPWPSGSLGNLHYASGWWSGTMMGHEVFLAQGHGGQNIVIVPDLTTVVVTTTSPDMGFDDSWVQSIETFDFVANDILVAVDAGAP